MKRKQPLSLGLALATSLWLALTVLVLLALPVSGRFDRSIRGASEEPPPDRSIWARLSDSGPVHEQEVLRARTALKSALAELGVPAWHSAGHQGQGVKIAILDSGFKGHRAALGKALPALVKVRSFRKDGELEGRESQHGILCGEVVHRLAPRAELLFANWEPEQPDSFLDAVRWARKEGARIISCSIIMPAWSDGEGHGKAHQALLDALGSGDRRGDGLFFASAGNTALRHWSGAFNADTNGWHQWIHGRKDNALRSVGKEGVSIELCGADGLELVLRDTTAHREVARSRTSAEDGSCSLRYVPHPGHKYSLRLRRREGEAAAGRFHLTVLGGRLQFPTRLGSVPFPGDGAEVVAVGAVDESGRRYSYSSCGGTAVAEKPDLVARSPFPSIHRAHQAFGGTSAAAPQAAALAALIWSRQPELTAQKVRSLLRQSARRSTPGHSVEMGFGVVHLPALEQ
jgi:subtilisin family serine protease